MTEEKKENTKKETKSRRRDTYVEKEYWEDIELTDPVSGKKIIQRVKIKRYASTPRDEDGNLFTKDMLEELLEEVKD